MNQMDLFITLEERTKYLIEYKGKIGGSWYMGGLFNFDSYHQANPDQVRVISRIGTPKEVFK